MRRRHPGSTRPYTLYPYTTPFRSGRVSLGDPHDAPPEAGDEALDYRLDQQVGFLLRRAHQHASEVFQSKIGNRNLTPQQFSVLVTLLERREIAQTRLGGLVDRKSVV